MPAGSYQLSCLQGVISQEVFQGPAFSPADSLVRLNLVLGSGCFLVVCGVEAFVLWRLFLCRQAELSWWGTYPALQQARGLRLDSWMV